MINVSVNISQYANQAGSITSRGCMDWCVQQHYSASYSGFMVLLIFNILMASVFMILFRYSEKIVHNTKLTEERLSIILNSVVACVFWANALYGVYWMFLR